MGNLPAYSTKAFCAAVSGACTLEHTSATRRQTRLASGGLARLARATRTLRSTPEQGRGRCSTPTAGLDTRPAERGMVEPLGRAARGKLEGALVTQEVQSDCLTPGRGKSSHGSVKGGTPQGPAGSTLRQQRRTPAPPHTRLGPRGHQNGPNLHNHSVAVDQTGDHRAVLDRAVTAPVGSGADGRECVDHYGWSQSCFW
jgi:hypothetical protein